jgi:peptidoglycan/xylan/chitin deacetylase (PgdA/CDA1 family)
MSYSSPKTAILNWQNSDMTLKAFAWGALSALSLVSPALAAQAQKTQVVLISFDGDHDNAQWQRSLALGAKTGAKFTYFLSCVNLISPENKMLYDAPDRGAGKSNVGFGDSRADVSARLMNIWRAHVSGHEIASHACGHFDGKDWTAAQWGQDLRSFGSIAANAWKINGETREPFGWRDFVAHDIVGFRAPYLSVSDGLEAALEAKHFAYDASGVERDITEPKIKNGIVRYALPMIEEGPAQRRIISMDYNLFVRHSNAIEQKDEGGVFEARTLEALNKAFDTQYNGLRHPLQLGLHFVLMNNGAYWKAMDTFASKVCVKPDVECITYKDYAARVKQTKTLAATDRAAKPKGS